MTPLAGLIAAIVAGWFVRDGRRAIMAIIVPFLAVLAMQSYGIAAGYGHSPPSTVTSYPGAIAYWVVQVIILAPALFIAAGLGSLRAGGRGTAARAAATAVRVSAGLTLAAGVFDLSYALQASPVRHHLVNGSPPVYGLAGMGLLIVCVAVLGVLLLRRRLAARRQAPAGVASSAIPAGERR
jgi:hypothetical protein